MLRLFTIAIVLLCGACGLFFPADGDAILKAWHGRDLDDMIIQWGPPAAIYTTRDGRRTATFSHSRVNEATQLYCNATVSTDPQGVIVDSQVDGNLGGCNRLFADKGRPNNL